MAFNLASPADRLAATCRSAALMPVGAPRPIVSYSNDTWLVDDARLGPAVLRIGWRGDVTRLDREVAVASQLADVLGYPEVLGHGAVVLGGHDLRWSLTRRLTGQPLDAAWPSLSRSQRRSAVARLAEMLRALHCWTPPTAVAELVAKRPLLDLSSGESIIGVDNNPLPISRVHAFAPHLAAVPFLDPGLARDAVAAIDELADLEPTLDDPAAHGLTHGDVHLNNMWWDGSRVQALLDVEWVRFGPPQLELERQCDNADADVRTGLDMYPPVLAWLLVDYPELAEVPRIFDRLRLYSLAHALRHVAVWTPDRAEADLAPDHPLVRLHRLVDGSWPAPGALPEVLLR